MRRNVLDYDPLEFVPLKQELHVRDEHGNNYHFVGEAIALCPVPAWPNIVAHDSVYRWEDDHGRVTHSTYQELWNDTYQREMKTRATTSTHA